MDIQNSWIRKTAVCGIAFLLSVIIGLSLLTAASYAPQAPVCDNLRSSVGELHMEGFYPRLYDHHASSQLDNWTDALILYESATMTHTRSDSVLTNPYYVYDSNESLDDYVWAEKLESFANGDTPDEEVLYARYWMGFRAVVRVLLTRLDYFQMRRLAGTAFFLLFFCAMLSVAGQADTKTAFAFAISILLVRPQIIANSLQFTCCFLIAFSAMLLVPYIVKRPWWDAVFFLEVGVLTMYFDFYTVPLVTVGFPLVYLAVLRARRGGETIRLAWLLRCVLIWLAGYALMWLAKLCLTSALTEHNALAEGFNSFFHRVGIDKTPELEECYDVGFAFRKIKEALFADTLVKKACKAGILLGGVSICVYALKNRMPLRGFFRYGSILLLAALPFGWFAVTAQPIVIHYWFQYRSVALTWWAIGAYLCLTFRNVGGVSNGNQ